MQSELVLCQSPPYTVVLLLLERLTSREAETWHLKQCDLPDIHYLNRIRPRFCYHPTTRRYLALKLPVPRGIRFASVSVGNWLSMRPKPYGFTFAG